MMKMVAPEQPRGGRNACEPDRSRWGMRVEGSFGQSGLGAHGADRVKHIIPRTLGCTEVFSTPSSHDQGIDAFGYRVLVAETPYGVTHGLTWIVQAKHYRARPRIPIERRSGERNTNLPP